MKGYCDGFAKVKGDPTDMAAYINGHDISGVKATDASTVAFTLTQPASDFLNILAMPFASPAPKEYLSYVPDSATFREHTVSDGPYQIVKYAANKEIDLDKNPAWDGSSDPLRHQYVDHIKITMGQDAQPVQQQIQAGTADMEWDTVVPTPDVPQLRAAKDDRLGIFPGLDTNPYLVFNLQSPNNGGALKTAKVRQAIEYAIDKVAIGQIYGGPALNTPLEQVIPPGNVGYDTSPVDADRRRRGPSAEADVCTWPLVASLNLDASRCGVTARSRFSRPHGAPVTHQPVPDTGAGGLSGTA